MYSNYTPNIRLIIIKKKNYTPKWVVWQLSGFTFPMEGTIKKTRTHVIQRIMSVNCWREYTGY